MRARGKVGLYFITGIKETQNGTRAARTRARITSTLTQQIKDAGSRSGEGFFDQKRDGSESLHSSWYGTPRSSRPPSLVCSSGGVITNTVQDRGARCRSSVVPPLPGGDGGVTDRATRGACSAGSGIV